MLIYNLDEQPKVIPHNVIKEWKESREKIVVVSRHNTEYLAGFLRQIRLPDAIMIGDNMVRVGIEQPPEYFVQCKSFDEALQVVHSLLHNCRMK